MRIRIGAGKRGKCQRDDIKRHAGQDAGPPDSPNHLLLSNHLLLYAIPFNICVNTMGPQLFPYSSTSQVQTSSFYQVLIQCFTPTRT